MAAAGCLALLCLGEKVRWDERCARAAGPSGRLVLRWVCRAVLCCKALR